MKLKDYIENLNKLAKEKPESLEYEVVSSIDDEGNGFNRVGYAPSLGHYNSDDKEFVAEDQFDEYWEEDAGNVKVNAVCIN